MLHEHSGAASSLFHMYGLRQCTRGIRQGSRQKGWPAGGPPPSADMVGYNSVLSQFSCARANNFSIGGQHSSVGTPPSTTSDMYLRKIFFSEKS